jgi:hypothetical protein
MDVLDLSLQTAALSSAEVMFICVELADTLFCIWVKDKSCRIDWNNA